MKCETWTAASIGPKAPRVSMKSSRSYESFCFAGCKSYGDSLDYLDSGEMMDWEVSVLSLYIGGIGEITSAKQQLGAIMKPFLFGHQVI